MENDIKTECGKLFTLEKFKENIGDFKEGCKVGAESHIIHVEPGLEGDVRDFLDENGLIWVWIDEQRYYKKNNLFYNVTYRFIDDKFQFVEAIKTYKIEDNVLQERTTRKVDVEIDIDIDDNLISEEEFYNGIQKLSTPTENKTTLPG